VPKHPVLRQNIECVVDPILDSLACALTRHPKLKVFETIVRPDAIEVVDRFALPELSAKMTLYYLAVFPDRLTGAGQAPIAVSVKPTGAPSIRVAFIGAIFRGRIFAR
jgi:hypothetical protein